MSEEVERLIKNPPKPFNYPSEDSRYQRRAYSTIDVDDFLERLEVAWNNHKTQLHAIIKKCPLVPDLTMMSIGDRSKLLAKHSIALDEWYHKLKKVLGEPEK